MKTVIINDKILPFISTIEELNCLKNRQKYAYKCVKCNKLVTRHQRCEKEMREFGKKFLCQKCGTIETNFNKFGTKHPVQSPIIQKKIKNTFAKNHNGMNMSEYYLSDEYQNFFKKRCLNKFGYDNPAKIPEIKVKIKKSWETRNVNQMVERAKQTKLDRYGDPNYYNVKKQIRTVEEKYHTDYYVKTNDFKEKSKLTKIERYNDPNYTNHEQCKQTKLDRYDDPYFNNHNKTLATLHDRYGKEISSTLQLENIKLKARETCQEKYNYIHYIGSEQWKKDMISMYGSLAVKSTYNYYSVIFDSSWEMAIWIYYKDHNINIIREPIVFEYVVENKVHYYLPDFWIGGIGLVEIKGSQFWDPNNPNVMVNPYDKNDKLSEPKHQCGLRNGVYFWKEKDIQPYLDYCISKFGGNKRWFDIFRINNPFNPSYANPNGYFPIAEHKMLTPIYYTPLLFNNQVTPNNKIDNDGYVMNENSHGITPFDIGK